MEQPNGKDYGTEVIVSSASGSELFEKSEDNLPTAPEVAYPSGIRLALIITALCLAVFLTSLDMTIVSTAIPQITDEFDSIQSIGWYGSAFFLTLSSFQSAWGKAYKFFSLKWTFLTAIFIFEIGSLICGVAKNSPILILGRAFAGIGGGGVFSGAFTIIAVVATPTKRPAYTGFVGASYGLSSVVGPLIGGLFTTHIMLIKLPGFYINIPIGAVAAVIIALSFKAPETAKFARISFKEKLYHFDIFGILTIMASVVCFVLALQKAGVTYPWRSSMVIGLLIGSILLFIIYCGIQYYLDERAMVVKRIAEDRTIWAGMAYIFCLASSSWLFICYIPIYFQVIDGVSAAESGIRTIPIVLGMTVATIIAGGAITAMGYHVPFLILSGALSVAGAALLYTLTIGTGSPAWLGYQSLVGLGYGFGIQIPIIAAQAVMKPEDVASATAMLLFAQTLGGSLTLSGAQSGFLNTIIKNLPTTAPGVDPLAVVFTGATDIRKAFPTAVIPGILRAYMDGLRVAFALGVAAAGGMMVTALISKWHNLKALHEERAKLEKGGREDIEAVEG